MKVVALLLPFSEIDVFGENFYEDNAISCAKKQQNAKPSISEQWATSSLPSPHSVRSKPQKQRRQEI